MSTPTPLLFVSSPPVYVHVPFDVGEGTPVFVEDEMPELEVKPVKPVKPVESFDKVNRIVPKELVELREVDPAILAKISKLESPIGQRVYRGLTFVLKDKEMVGDVLNVEENAVFIAANGDENEVVAVDLVDLRNIIWRGKELPEN